MCWSDIEEMTITCWLQRLASFRWHGACAVGGSRQRVKPENRVSLSLNLQVCSRTQASFKPFCSHGQTSVCCLKSHKLWKTLCCWFSAYDKKGTFKEALVMHRTWLCFENKTGNRNILSREISWASHFKR